MTEMIVHGNILTEIFDFFQKKLVNIYNIFGQIIRNDTNFDFDNDFENLLIAGHNNITSNKTDHNVYANHDVPRRFSYCSFRNM